MLNIYGNQFGLSNDLLEQFAQQVNQRDEAGSLHPRAPISVIPRRYIRDGAEKEAIQKQIAEFISSNERIIRASIILIDFRAGITPFILEAIKGAMAEIRSPVIDEIMIIDSN
jgi:hypothetical protein